MKHIEFAHGYYFLYDLKDVYKAHDPYSEDLAFSYNFKDHLKVDIDKLKQKKAEKEEENKKEFEKLKSQIDQKSSSFIAQNSPETKDRSPTEKKNEGMPVIEVEEVIEED